MKDRNKYKDIELLIFDLDGTLVDSKYDLCDAVNFALKKLGKPLLSYSELPKLLGSGLKFLLTEAMNENDPERLKTAFPHFDTYYSQNYTRKTQCYPGVRAMLQHLDQKKKAIFSNKNHTYTQGIIQTLDLTTHFEIIMGAQSDKYPLKPSPEGINLILNELAVKPENALIIGDSTHDVEAGQAAGIHTCAVTYGYRSASQLQKVKPDFMIDNMDQLQAFVI